MKEIITRPLSTATPDSAMKPTAAEIDSGMPRIHSATMPPVSANGMPVNTSRPSFRLPNIANSSTNTSSSATGTTICSRCRGRLQVLELPAPRGPVAGRHLDLLLHGLRASADERAEVAAAHVGAHHDPALAVLAADLVGPRRRGRASPPRPAG